MTNISTVESIRSLTKSVVAECESLASENQSLRLELESARKRIAELEANQPSRESVRPVIRWEFDNATTVWTGVVNGDRRCGIYVDEAGQFDANVRAVDGEMTEAKLLSLGEAKAWCEREVRNAT